MIRTMIPGEPALERAPKLLSHSAPPELLEEAVSLMSEVRAAGYEFAAIALAGCDPREVLRNLRVPALLIWCEEDQITPLWKDLPEGARLAVIPFSGHRC